MKVYHKAPLPFMGQKRNLVKQTLEVLGQVMKPDRNWRVVDVFGGSGLLSHNIKQAFPRAEVIYNDFDDYQGRLNKIEKTNTIRKELLGLGVNNAKGRLPAQIKEQILNLIEAKDKEELDLETVSQWILFSGNSTKNLDELRKRHFYARVVKNDYQAEGYLEGVIRVQMDFKACLDQYQDKNTLLICDPPYINTDQSRYKSEFTKYDAQDLLQRLKAPFVLYSSDKSPMINYTREYFNGKPLAPVLYLFERKNSVNYRSYYADQMIIGIDSEQAMGVSLCGYARI